MGGVKMHIQLPVFEDFHGFDLSGEMVLAAISEIIVTAAFVGKS